MLELQLPTITYLQNNTTNLFVITICRVLLSVPSLTQVILSTLIPKETMQKESIYQHGDFYAKYKSISCNLKTSLTLIQIPVICKTLQLISTIQERYVSQRETRVT
jgi:hypothetical protein